MRKMPKKVVERETSRRGRATAAKLIEFAAKELDRVGPVKFDIDSVLRKSKFQRVLSITTSEAKTGCWSQLKPINSQNF